MTVKAQHARARGKRLLCIYLAPLSSGYRERRVPKHPLLRSEANIRLHRTLRGTLLENVDPVVGYVLGGALGFGAGKTPLLDNGGVIAA